MGAKTSHPVAEPFTHKVEERIGKIPVNGRYHRLPNRLEDHYDVCDVALGSGLNGVVRLAHAKGAENSPDFAVKSLKIKDVDPVQLANFQSEVNVFLGMDHPHVARLFDVYETEDRLYLVMECLEGGELFERVINSDKRQFKESDAAEAVRQMLLAINYLHSHGIVHRDLKLENFLYDFKIGDHLKLIDFGFSKVWDQNSKMQATCGTLSYVAPEVLTKSYTSQCDLWSLGVISFILLSGYMPFAGDEKTQIQKILKGKYTLKPEKWCTISCEARSFVEALLRVNPRERLTAEGALAHPWIEKRFEMVTKEVDESIVDSLRAFGQASRFRRCCLEMMAWSLSNKERAEVREYFVSMDTSKQGTITLGELKQVMVGKFDIPEGETKRVFEALDSNRDETIHYSDFLAAMVSTRIKLHSDLLRSAFRKFDLDNSGFITPENLRGILGETVDGENVECLMKEADLLNDGRISYPEFVAYLSNTPLDAHVDSAEKVIQTQLERKVSRSFTLRRGAFMKMKLKEPGSEKASPYGSERSPRKQPSGLQKLSSGIRMGIPKECCVVQ